jgi:hypothetical protein
MIRSLHTSRRSAAGRYRFLVFGLRDPLCLLIGAFEPLSLAAVRFGRYYECLRFKYSTPSAVVAWHSSLLLKNLYAI